MITELKIENYKSIQDLTLDVGRVNVLIGENGCGKSNILEAITFAAAAEANKLDNEFLVSRGIRVTEPKLMRSVFKKNAKYEDNIKVFPKFNNIDAYIYYIMKNDNFPYSKWVCEQECFFEFQSNDKKHDSQKTAIDLGFIENEMKLVMNEMELVENKIKLLNSDIINNKLKKITSHFKKYNPIIEEFEVLGNLIKELQNFIIYAPENSTLRNFEKEAQIQPLGINGEGLFKLLTVIQSEARESEQAREELNDIEEALELFGWYETINIPDDYRWLDKSITIKDRYLEVPFDQRSANEGFLLVLFYITLVVSKYTPKIFAIDNIDTSLNPKLCTKLIKELARLAKKYDKQLFVTSHNPAILDGIDLGDDEQRLFVVSRNKQGHTRCKRIDINDKPKSSVRDRLSKLFNDNETYTKEDILNKFDNSEEPLKLSYALLRGYLGGLPKNF